MTDDQESRKRPPSRAKTRRTKARRTKAIPEDAQQDTTPPASAPRISPVPIISVSALLELARLVERMKKRLERRMHGPLTERHRTGEHRDRARLVTLPWQGIHAGQRLARPCDSRLDASGLCTLRYAQSRPDGVPASAIDRRLDPPESLLRGSTCDTTPARRPASTFPVVSRRAKPR